MAVSVVLTMDGGKRAQTGHRIRSASRWCVISGRDARAGSVPPPYPIGQYRAFSAPNDKNKLFLSQILRH